MEFIQPAHGNGREPAFNVAKTVTDTLAVARGKETPPTHSKVYHSITEPRSLSDRVKKRRHTLECVPRNYGPGPVTSHSIEFPFLWSSGRATWTRSLRLLGSVVSG